MSSPPPSDRPGTPLRPPPSPGRGAAIACALLALGVALVAGDAVRTASPSGAATGPGRPQAAPGAAPAAPPAVGTERLEGRVVDPQGAGIPSASVRAVREGVEGDAAWQVSAAGDGRFALTQLPAGRWLLRASAPGFGVSAVVRDVPGAGEATITLARVGRIAGQVFGVDGDPAAGAELVLAGSGVWPARSARAGSDGRFVLEDVPPGVYEVQARGEQAAAQPRRGLVVEAGGRAFLTFRLEPGATMIGAILDAETERPIEGAEIVVMQGELGVAPRALRSGPDGGFRAAGLRGDDQRVTVHADGYVPVVARPWAPGEPLRIAMEPGATLSGVVLDARRRPVEGARLEVLGEAGDRQPIAMDGPSVAFRAEVFHAHEQARPASLGALEVTAGDVPPIPLVPAAELGALPVAALGAAGATPAPSIGAVVSGYVSAADGSFRIEGVPAGHVQIVAHHAGFAPGSSERVWVAPGRERERIEIVLAPSGRIDGEVVDAEGEAVGQVLIEHRSDAEPWPRVAVSDDEGRFALEDVAGAVTLRAMPPGRAAVQVRIDVGPGGRETARIVLPAEGLVIAGRTVDEQGRPIERAQVRVESMAPGPSSPRVAFSDERGRFEIADAPPGPWRATVDHVDHAQGEPIDLDRVDADLRLVVRAGVQVTGSVIDRARLEGIEGATIALERASVPPVVRSARSDVEGSFVIPRALPGRYLARVSAPGFVEWSGEIDVAASRAGAVELEGIELDAGATLEGDVVDALGQVVRGVEIAVEEDPARTARTDAAGHFALGGLGAGAWTIRAAHPAAGEVSRAIRVSASRDPAALVLRLPRRYSPDDAESERALRRGVAIEVASEAGLVRVASVPAGTRGASAGVRAGDVLVAVDGEAVEGAAGAARLLRGADGVDAVLELEREGERFRVRVAREAW